MNMNEKTIILMEFLPDGSTKTLHERKADWNESFWPPEVILWDDSAFVLNLMDVGTATYNKTTHAHLAPS